MNFIERSWDGWHPITWLLLPLSGLFCLLGWLRRLAYRAGWLRSQKLAVPVIIVGNISVGGTGKTPLIVWLAQHLLERGRRPGIILRGYGATADKLPREVTAASQPDQVGDEAVLIGRRTGCPVVVGRDRVEAGRLLLQNHDCDLILSDDGLQHYALQRDLEIVVIDGARRFGNGLCLPAGPLRERTSRLRRADLVIVNGRARKDEYGMQVEADRAISLMDGEARSLIAFQRQTVHALAGIGHPERFFNTLKAAGLRPECHAFPDHHPYREEELRPFSDQTVLMTEKDGVKCEEFGLPDLWFVPARAEPDEGFQRAFDVKLERLIDG
ncbi:MAG: tetraacyldisaccharide 4'-kinase [Chromatiales bacterium]